MSELIQRNYHLPSGVLIDFDTNLKRMLQFRAHDVAKHRMRGCGACLIGPGSKELLSYEDLLIHWKLEKIELRPCFVCGRDYPASEYLICEVADICRHCQVERGEKDTRGPG